MKSTQGLRKDHASLRRQLALLEARLATPDTLALIRGMCASLSRILTEHIRKEARALAPYSNRLHAVLQQRFLDDHEDEQVVLRELNALVASGAQVSTGALIRYLSRLIEELREHMDEEERSLFPVVDRAGTEQEVSA